MIQSWFNAYTARSNNSQEGVRPDCCAPPKTTFVRSYSTFLAPQTNCISFLAPIYLALTGTFSSDLNQVWKSTTSKHPDLHHQQLSSFTFIAEKFGRPERRALYLPVPLCNLCSLPSTSRLFLVMAICDKGSWAAVALATAMKNDTFPSPDGANSPLGRQNYEDFWSWRFLAGFLQ